jgi:hypothetical protein
MAVVGASIIINATGPTAIVAPASTAYSVANATGAVAAYTVSRNARWRTCVINCTGAGPVWIGGSATGATGTGATGTMAEVFTFPITVPLGPDEGLYATLNSGNSIVGVIVTGA